VYAVALCPGAYGGHKWEDVKKSWEVARNLIKEGGRGDYVFGQFPIGRLEHNWETVGFIDNLIKQFSIDTVITHHYGESHQDHIAAQKVAVSAARRSVDTLWLWETSIYTHRNVFPFRAQLYVPISSKSFQEKVRTLQAYLDADLLQAEEVEAHRHLARYRGAEMHRDYAEAFEVVWQVHAR
jgi:LmbE family N-acetylglucosaminyl deacetylase